MLVGKKSVKRITFLTSGTKFEKVWNSIGIGNEDVHKEKQFKHVSLAYMYTECYQWKKNL